MNNNNTLGIHFIGLDAKETALFERVVSFSKTHGLEAEVIDDVADADLIVVADEQFSKVEHLSNSKTLVVVANNEDIDKGDFQVGRPLMITKVMNLLKDALVNAKDKKANGPSDGSVSTINEAPAEEVEVEAKAHHALVIDDSAAIRKQLELELRDAGISSDYAVSGEDALEKIKNEDVHYDLIFLDIIMPGIDGYETCKGMRADPRYKKAPIIMLSGKTSPLDEVQGVIAGATTYLTKPVKSDRLQVTLNRVTKWIDNYAPAKKKETA